MFFEVTRTRTDVYRVEGMSEADLLDLAKQTNMGSDAERLPGEMVTHWVGRMISDSLVAEYLVSRKTTDGQPPVDTTDECEVTDWDFEPPDWDDED